jgi:preprotein translocase subunit YajC
MNSLFETFNLLQTAAPAGGSGSMLYTLGMFGLVFLIFYLLIIRPQNKRQKETKAMLDQLKKGDKVQSIGGIRGVIKSVKEDSVVVTVDTNTDMEFVRSAIANVINPEAKNADKADKKETKKETKKESEAK